MTEQLTLAGLAPAPPARRFRRKSTTIPKSAEVATIQKGEFLGEFGLYEFPNLSDVLQKHSDGRGLRLFDDMFRMDGDLKALATDLEDDVVKSPLYVSAASKDSAHIEHKRFLDMQIERMNGFQASHRHILKAYGYGFTVQEKVFEVVTRGEWAGAVVLKKLVDKPSRWFTFDLDRRLRIRTGQSYSPGELLDPAKFVVTTWGTNNTPWGDPMLAYVYWTYRLRHHAFKGEAIYFDKWANPTGLVQYEASQNSETNAANRAKAVEVMQAIQNDQTIGVPKGLVLDLLESKRSGSISWDQYRESLRQILSRLWTGQILLGTGDKGGSYAAMKVHQEQEGNRVEALGDFSGEEWTDIFKDVIDRNYGPQDLYPTVQVFTKSLAEQQANLEVTSLKQITGHPVSAAWSNRQIQNVLPEGPDDVLTPPSGLDAPKVPQPLPVREGYSAREASSARIRAHMAGFVTESSLEAARFAARAKHAAAYSHASTLAAAARAHLTSVAADTKAKARPAIKKAITSMGSRIRNKKTARSVTKAWLLKGMKGQDHAPLGNVFDTMIQKSPTYFAAGDTSSDAAKIALALLLYSIVDAIAREAAGAAEDLSATDFANSLLDDNATSGSVFQTQAGIFDNIHFTNIASIATAALRAKLADPAFREAYPYVMIVALPDARLDHRMMDGFVLSAEEARWSDLLPPYAFGCRCVAVPIAADEAARLGLIGANPSGTLDAFLRAQGATPRTFGGAMDWTTAGGHPFTAGPVRGFDSAFPSTDMYSQLAALRQKASDLQAEDPEAWAAMHAWLLALFTYDILTTDPKEDPNVPN